MNRVKIFLLCLVLLALAGMLHHQWDMVTPARAAVLQNGSGQSCSGTGTWHFVNNQTGGACGSGITAVFTGDGGACNGTTGLSSIAGTQTKCLSSVDQYIVSTSGSCTLVSATTGSVPGNLVLSDFTCTPTPTPSPSPAPSPTGTP